eukprot:c20018_g1_i3.p1 GENE.c20018_g1_i3~~c20018_g1_i3.p1  ORF type:complete len:187 (+),score=39.76 c20018_g1_i3:25-561(+)
MRDPTMWRSVPPIKALVEAVKDGDVRQVSAMLTATPSLKDKPLNKIRGRAIHYAILHRKIDVLKMLCKLGCDTNVQEKSGSTPLVTAIHRGKAEAAQVLIELGADLTYETKERGMVCARAAALERGHVHIIEAIDHHVRLRLQTFLMGTLRRGGSVVLGLPVDVLALIANRVISNKSI